MEEGLWFLAGIIVTIIGSWSAHYFLTRREKEKMKHDFQREVLRRKEEIGANIIKKLLSFGHSFDFQKGTPYAPNTQDALNEIKSNSDIFRTVISDIKIFFPELNKQVEKLLEAHAEFILEEDPKKKITTHFGQFSLVKHGIINEISQAIENHRKAIEA